MSAFLTATGFVGFLSHPEDIGEADAADAYPKENALNEGTEAYAAQRVSGYAGNFETVVFETAVSEMLLRMISFRQQAN